MRVGKPEVGEIFRSGKSIFRSGTIFRSGKPSFRSGKCCVSAGRRSTADGRQWANVQLQGPESRRRMAVPTKPPFARRTGARRKGNARCWALRVEHHGGAIGAGERPTAGTKGGVGVGRATRAVPTRPAWTSLPMVPVRLLRARRSDRGWCRRVQRVRRPGIPADRHGRKED
jgi:hypothetical protein